MSEYGQIWLILLINGQISDEDRTNFHYVRCLGKFRATLLGRIDKRYTRANKNALSASQSCTATRNFGGIK